MEQNYLLNCPLKEQFNPTVYFLSEKNYRIKMIPKQVNLIGQRRQLVEYEDLLVSSFQGERTLIKPSVKYHYFPAKRLHKTILAHVDISVRVCIENVK